MQNLKVPNSERLTFKLMDDSDAELLWQLDQNVEVMRFINGGKVPSLKEINEVLLPRMNSYRNPQYGWGIWKVLSKDDSEYLGWILVRPMHFFSDERDDENLELGWRFHQHHWGYGYATEASKAIMLALSEQQGIIKFSAIADPGNHASINIMQKLGMTFDKRDLFKDPLIDMEVDYYSVQY